MDMLGKIRRLRFRDGLSISEICRRTGLARNTVKRWLKAEEGAEPRYRRKELATLLTPYEDRLRQWFEADARRAKRDRRTALTLFGLWAAGTSDVANVMYGWPSAALIIASACVLVAAVLALLSLIMLPAIWRGGRRVDSWSALRKASFTFTVLVYTAFSVLLGLWGALTPWNG